jgi:nucleotide sugar dehydrogenase
MNGEPPVGVLGRGHVGRGVEELFQGHREVVAWDVADDRALPADDLARCEFVFVCVGTPEGPDGSADLSAVHAALGTIPGPKVVLKSTVPPGTTTVLADEYQKDICFWPEYIGESRYHNPFFAERIVDVPFVILGGPSRITQETVDLLLPVLGPTKSYFQCRAIEAELIKYTENTFFASKVTFVNEMRNIASRFGADWHTIREGWLLDPRVSPMHTAAFATDPGFSGKCLPKDLAALIAAASEAGYDPQFLRAIQSSNERFRNAAGSSHDQA